jgi:flagellar basal-body rod protein FlgB
MDLRSVKHNLTVSNIANMDTPNYKGYDLLVEEEMQKWAASEEGGSLDTTHAEHIGNPSASNDPLRFVPMPENGFTSGMEGNTVDMDVAMASLAENSLKYNASAQILTKKFQGLKSVIIGGGGK